MKRFTKFQEAQLAYAVTQGNGGLLVKTGAYQRAFREDAIERCWLAFDREGYIIKTRSGNLTHWDLDEIKAQAYIDKFNCTVDFLYNRGK